MRDEFKDKLRDELVNNSKDEPKEENRHIDTFAASYIDTCSANDCTGLIPSLPQCDGDLESYEELYGFLPKAKKTAAK